MINYFKGTYSLGRLDIEVIQNLKADLQEAKERVAQLERKYI